MFNHQDIADDQSISHRTCLKCGTVAFGVSRAFAEDGVVRFNAYFDTLPPEGKDMFGNRHSSITQYEHCIRCDNSFANFRDALPGDCPDGCTLNPIIVES